MREILLTLIFVACAAYLSGNMIRQRADVCAFLETLESGCLRWSRRLADTPMRLALLTLRRLYGWVAVVAVTAGIAGVHVVLPHAPTLVWAIALIGMIACVFWFSLYVAVGSRESINPKQNKSSSFTPMLLMFAMPVILGAVDVVSDTQFARLSAAMFVSDASPQVSALLEPLLSMNPLIIGVAVSAMLVAFVAVYLALLYAVFMPIAGVASMPVVAVITFARLLDRALPTVPMVGVVLAVLAAATYASLQ